MKSVRHYKNDILKKCVFVCACICFLFIALHKTQVVRGFLLGACISMINFHLLSVDMAKLSILEVARFRSLMIVRFFLRYGIIALAMYGAFLYNLNIVLFIVGLLMVQMIIVVDNVSKIRQTL